MVRTGLLSCSKPCRLCLTQNAKTSVGCFPSVCYQSWETKGSLHHCDMPGNRAHFWEGQTGFLSKAGGYSALWGREENPYTSLGFCINEYTAQALAKCHKTWRRVLWWSLGVFLPSLSSQHSPDPGHTNHDGSVPVVTSPGAGVSLLVPCPSQQLSWEPCPYVEVLLINIDQRS